jgi:hypothetical protein
VIYPGEWHIPDRPSFLVDRYRRYLEWMGRYLRETPASAAQPAQRSSAAH